ncbi:hypothetical protein C8R44DRAFT_632715, partial [Mycena epipterygia]
LYCLNLPIEIRFLLENVFILGLILLAGSPDVWTISHILPFLTECINSFVEPGKVLEAHDNPQADTDTRPLPLIADLGTACKVAGYVSHSADCFCSFCHIRKDQIDNLKWNKWSYCDAHIVHAQALAWKALRTIQDQNTESMKNGVQWTPMHNVYTGPSCCEFNSVPNHHLAMHNGDQMKFWGPLALLSKFPGERMNGGLGKIKTN